MEKVEFVGSVTDLSYSRPSDDDDDDFCPSADGGRAVACCSPGLD